MPRWRGFGYSGLGTEHARLELPNQDAYDLRHYAVGDLAVVCDGLGSKTQSHLGSKQACRAARDAFRYWGKLRHSPPLAFISLLHTMWNMRVLPHDPRDCATTCLCIALTGGRMVLAQLGDGLIGQVDSGGNSLFHTPEQEGFANETTSLGGKVNAADWVLVDAEEPEPGSCLIAASDGFSEILEPENLGELCHWLRDDFGALDTRARNKALDKEFGALSKAQRGDDHTFVLLWRST